MQRGAFLFLLLATFAEFLAKIVAQTAFDLLGDGIDARQRIGTAQPGFDLFGLEAGPARDGEGPAFQVDGDEAAPVALGQEEPALFQRVPEARQIIGRSPGLLEGLLDLARVEAELFGLLPFFQGEVERAFPAIGAVAWGSSQPCSR